ncbi:MAG: membrane protein insertion efficiency factor YidD [Bacteroidales bacterium]|nr:membrane protein insertion efficiency factor YidD [Bacteroidales bacterium]
MNGKILLTGLFLVSGLVSIPGINAQSLYDHELATLYNKSDTSQSDYTEPLREAKNEIDITISAFFLFYKTFISSQDMPTCVFTPSCSVYTVQAFQKKGLLLGWLSTFDRLSRCHGLVNPVHYHFDTNKMRFYDPVR